MPGRCSQPIQDRPVDRAGARVALLTPAGRGALAVVGVTGREAIAMAARLFSPRGPEPLAGRPDGAIVFGRWGDGGSGPGEDLIVVRRGADDLEIHCHGGFAASEAIITGLERLGAVRQAWTEWLRERGAGEIELEAREALTRAGGPTAARILSRQLAGSLGAELVRIEGLVRAGRSSEARAAIERLQRASRVGLRLVRPWRVVLAGRVNAGKSSLFNALAGHARCIVSPEPGTTRDLVESRIVLDGWELEIIDTAGLRDESGTAGAASAVERTGIARAVAARDGADLVLHVVDARAVVAGAVAGPGGRELLVASKADLAGLPAAGGPAGTVWTSAITGAGIADLAAEIVRRLVPEWAEEPELFGGAVPFTERQVGLLEALAKNG